MPIFPNSIKATFFLVGVCYSGYDLRKLSAIWKILTFWHSPAAGQVCKTGIASPERIITL